MRLPLCNDGGIYKDQPGGGSRGLDLSGSAAGLTKNDQLFSFRIRCTCQVFKLKNTKVQVMINTGMLTVYVF